VITSIDTSIPLDLFGADPKFGAACRRALARSVAEGRVIACEPVWAETVALFPSADEALGALEGARAYFDPRSREAAMEAASAWRVYRQRRRRRARVVADFLVGAHALYHADRLLTRDRGFYRSYFEKLPILDPAERVVVARLEPASLASNGVDVG